MKLNRTILLLSGLLAALSTRAQSDLITHSKSLAFFNPALNNYDYDNLYLNTSYLTNPLSDESNFSSYLIHAEGRLGEAFVLGLHRSTVENRLNYQEMSKLYAGIDLELDEGNRFGFGLELGQFTDRTKAEEFNQVFAPTYHQFEDSSITQLDFGFGLSFESKGWTVGLSVNKVNGPKVVPFPAQFWELDTSRNVAVKKDTAVTITEDDFGVYGVQSNVNVIYEWEVKEGLELLHSLHVANISATGISFISFQNFARFNEKLEVGLGIAYAEKPGYILSGAYRIGDKLDFSIATFIREEFTFNPDADYPYQKINGYTIDAKGAYEASGIVPSFEASLRVLL